MRAYGFTLFIRARCFIPEIESFRPWITVILGSRRPLSIAIRSAVFRLPSPVQQCNAKSYTATSKRTARCNYFLCRHDVVCVCVCQFYVLRCTRDERGEYACVASLQAKRVYTQKGLKGERFSETTNIKLLMTPPRMGVYRARLSLACRSRNVSRARALYATEHRRRKLNLRELWETRIKQSIRIYIVSCEKKKNRFRHRDKTFEDSLEFSLSRDTVR